MSSATDLDVIMSNLHIDITCAGHQQLVIAMNFACSVMGIREKFPSSGKFAGFTHFVVRPALEAIRIEQQPWMNKRARPQRLVLVRCFGAPEPGTEKLPFTIYGEGAAFFAWQWLREATFPKQPDHDGDNVRDGWRLLNCDGYSTLTIEPTWREIGK